MWKKNHPERCDFNYECDHSVTSCKIKFFELLKIGKNPSLSLLHLRRWLHSTKCSSRVIIQEESALLYRKQTDNCDHHYSSSLLQVDSWEIKHSKREDTFSFRSAIAVVVELITMILFAKLNDRQWADYARLLASLAGQNMYNGQTGPEIASILKQLMRCWRQQRPHRPWTKANANFLFGKVRKNTLVTSNFTCCLLDTNVKLQRRR
ncbi:Exosome complex component RRP42 [Trichinella spiralis]|uniref:Exosome complex component RRP42 n=1 Tax=Trichinella spiralis TaxID=6334 RepID=A0ABR3KXT2_TRISP